MMDHIAKQIASGQLEVSSNSTKERKRILECEGLEKMVIIGKPMLFAVESSSRLHLERILKKRVRLEPFGLHKTEGEEPWKS